MKRHFSLLEVLVAFMLISLSLPLLIAPFMYASVDQKERVDKMRAETAAQFAITSFLIDLQQQKISFSQVSDNNQMPLPKEWFDAMGGNIEGFLSLSKLKPVRAKESEDPSTVEVELWEVAFTFTSLSLKKLPYFSFKFTVVRQENS